jgi:hypothetical protein
MTTDVSDETRDVAYAAQPKLDEATLLTIASDAQADPLDLRLRLGLHAPRLGPGASRTDLIGEARRLALEAHAVAPPELRQRPPDVPADVNDTLFCVVDEDEARFVNERLHYLRSHRPQSRSFGLRTPLSNSLIALVSVSPADETQLEPLLPPGVRLDETAVVSRVFSQRWAPRNAISYLLARVERALVHASGPPRFALTYVNANLGFTGASYRAVNWSVIGTDPATHYSYVDATYQSDRQLLGRFGTALAAELDKRLGVRFQRVSKGLQPLLVFGKPVEG